MRKLVATPGTSWDELSSWLLNAEHGGWWRRELNNSTGTSQEKQSSPDRILYFLMNKNVLNLNLLKIISVSLNLVNIFI